MKYLLEYIWHRITGQTADNFRQWVSDKEYEEWIYGEDEDDLSQAWLCICGHYEESGLHCSYCGNEPPWGCDCSDCWDRREEEYYATHPEERDEWLASWEDYPGELLADNLDFESL